MQKNAELLHSLFVKLALLKLFRFTDLGTIGFTKEHKKSSLLSVLFLFEIFKFGIRITKEGDSKNY